MTRAELIALARRKAVEQQLCPEIVCAVCEQESDWDPWALRFEPAFYARYVAPLYVTSDLAWTVTEAHARATSWGLMQVLGQVAREHGFAGAYLSELCDPAVGLEVGCRVLAAKLGAAEGNLQRALLLWNGGSNTQYPAQVLARAEKYKASPSLTG